jgi:hypothetical protein
MPLSMSRVDASFPLWRNPLEPFHPSVCRRKESKVSGQTIYSNTLQLLPKKVTCLTPAREASA